MNDRGLLSEAEVVGVLEDAATSREHAAAASLAGEVYLTTAELIRAIVGGGNPVRRLWSGFRDLSRAGVGATTRTGLPFRSS
ncbi:hypothetical protein B6V75_08005 [Thioclava sp. F1Mire-8]|nr:hypothetical protein B6V75_08005 [Thioclava sp. F1Mire-8]